MADILHRVGIAAPPGATYQALATRSGLASWWTDETHGESEVGGELKFRFGQNGGFDMKVLALKPEERVRWEVTAGPAEWLGTTIDFELHREGTHTIVLFSHRDWREPVEFMHHCSTKWAVFLLSLKRLLETGRGAPFPNDVKIDNWN